MDSRSHLQLPGALTMRSTQCEAFEPRGRTVCWVPTGNRMPAGGGFEQLLLAEHTADSVVLAVDADHGPFRLAYRLAWDDSWRIRDAELVVSTERSRRSLKLHADGRGAWRDGDGRLIPDLEGCMDIDIWPTPFTNSFPVRRVPMAVGERREFRVAWVVAPELRLQPQLQAYTRLDQRRYRFENLDGTGFEAELAVDEDGVVLDYPDFFRRV